MELTILMPCLNEAKTVEKCVRSALDFLNRANIHGEVLIADNGSSDGSQEIAKSAGARVVNVRERGYGAALLGGIGVAQGRFIIMGDADDSYDFKNLDPFVDSLRSGEQLVMGNRFKGGIQPGAMPILHRWLGNPVLSALGRIFFRINIGDFHCGLRGFHGDAIRDLHLNSPGMEFATEMVAKASFAGLKIAEVPTTLKPDGRDRPPHLRTWRDGWRHLRFMLLFSPLWLFLIPGLSVLLLSLTGLTSLWFGPISIGNIGLDFHTMLYCGAGVILGFQSIQWGVWVIWLGVNSGMRSKPKNKGLKKLIEKPNIELGLSIGVAIFTLGLLWSIGLAGAWLATDFARIVDNGVLRSAIVASTLMVIGLQIVGGSLFFGALRASIDSNFIRLRNNKS